jgi:hypothetical protein
MRDDAISPGLNWSFSPRIVSRPRLQRASALRFFLPRLQLRLTPAERLLVHSDRPFEKFSALLMRCEKILKTRQ